MVKSRLEDDPFAAVVEEKENRLDVEKNRLVVVVEKNRLEKRLQSFFTDRPNF